MHLLFEGFEWDINKARANTAKHGISFEEASTVFDDYHARVIPDPDHSQQEDRFVILGASISAKVLVVCHCLRRESGNIRIISARRATKSEEATYWRLRNEI